jgi:AAA lid domain
MSYRDDGDALLERIAALERQAARVEQLERRVRELEQENRSLLAAAATATATDVDSLPVAGGAEQVYVDAKIHGYVEALLAATRAPADCLGLEAYAAYLLSGARPADVTTVVEAARVHAVEADRSYVTPADILKVGTAILCDRVLLSDRAAKDGVTLGGFIDTLFDVVEVP